MSYPVNMNGFQELLKSVTIKDQFSQLQTIHHNALHINLSRPFESSTLSIVTAWCSESAGSSVGGFLSQGQKFSVTNYRGGSKARKILFFESSDQRCLAQTGWVYSVCSVGVLFWSQFYSLIHSHTPLALLCTHPNPPPPPKKIPKPNKETRMTSPLKHLCIAEDGPAPQPWGNEPCVGLPMQHLTSTVTPLPPAPSSTAPAASVDRFGLQAPGHWQLWRKKGRGWTMPRVYSWVYAALADKTQHKGSWPGLQTRSSLKPPVHLWTNDFVSPHLFPNISPLHETLSTDDPLWNSARR